MNNSGNGQKKVYELDASKILGVELSVLVNYGKRIDGGDVNLPIHREVTKAKKLGKIYYFEDDLIAFKKSGAALPVFEESKVIPLVEITKEDMEAKKKYEEEMKQDNEKSKAKVKRLF